MKLRFIIGIALVLGAVTWLEGFGTMLDKTRRLEALGTWLYAIPGAGTAQGPGPGR